MRGWFQDIRYGSRTLLRTPTFTALAVLTLALGIGANTTIFSWMNATLLNPIPGVSHTAGLLSILRGGAAETPYPFSYPDYVDLRDQNHSLSGLAGFSIYSMTLTGHGRPERIWGSVVSTNYFDVLGIKPVLGRGFGTEDEQKPGAAPFVVVSYRFWQTHLGGDSFAAGRTIHLNQQPFTVIGIAPPLFQGTQTGLRSELWIPASMQQTVRPDSDLLHARDASWFFLLGRLKPGVTRGQGGEDLNLVMQHIAAQYPDEHKGHDTLTVYPLWRAPFSANQYLYLLLPMLMVITGFVLLLACANVANLLLVRSIGRRREIAIRLSLGASRWRLVQQSLLESLLLALLGGAAAMLITTWTAGTFMKFMPPAGLPVSLDMSVDGTVLFATFIISIFTGLIFGILPALRSSRLAPLGVLKEEGTGSSGGLHKARLSSVLAVSQLSLSLLLLVCAGLFIRSFQNAEQANPGFNASHVLLGSFELVPSAYKQKQGLEFQRQLLAKLQALPDVQVASMATWVPLGFALSSSTIKVEGYTPPQHESMDIDDSLIAPSYLRTMQIPLLEGREFTLQDGPGSLPVAMVNQVFAERYWPHQDAIGKRVYVGGEGGKWFSVVGVARNCSYSDLKENAKPFLYLPLFQEYSNWSIVHVRVAGDPAAFAPTLEKTIHELNGDLPVFDVDTLQSRVQVASTTERIAGTFVGTFGLLALVLAAVGIYGVVSYATRQRTREIGIRLALGAQRRSILRLVLNQGVTLIAIGLAIGLAMAFLLTRFLKSLLFAVAAIDLLTFASVAVLLASMALLACYLPARRAMRVDPVIALRHE